jgi:hypothetical protein
MSDRVDVNRNIEPLATNDVIAKQIAREVGTKTRTRKSSSDKGVRPCRRLALEATDSLFCDLLGIVVSSSLQNGPQTRNTIMKTIQLHNLYDLAAP